jgi:hypothetical protein
MLPVLRLGARGQGAAALACLLAACSVSPSPSGSSSPTLVVSASSAPSGGATASPTPAREPALSLALPPRRDARRVRFSVVPAVKAAGGGQIVVNVTNLSATRIDEIVLRWPTALRDTLFLAPFAPSSARIAEFGPPLNVPWTKWVDGPGEHNEPAGTTSLGWGPLLPGARLTIPLVVTRRGPGPVAFDLQFLAGVSSSGAIPSGGDALLADPAGRPAETRVTVP